MTSQKIQHLVNLIERLENKDQCYSWSIRFTCNCGILSQVVTQLSDACIGELLPDAQMIYDELNSELFDFGPVKQLEFVQSKGYSLVNDDGFIPSTWTGLAIHQEICQRTGIPLNEVFQSLLDAEFTFEDICRLENCGKTREEVIEYVRSWIARLQSE